MFLSYLKRNPADCNKLWYVFSWVNSPYSNVNVFHLTWTMSLHYLVNLALVFCKWLLELWIKKNTPQFLSHQNNFSHLVVISIVDRGLLILEFFETTVFSVCKKASNLKECTHDVSAICLQNTNARPMFCKIVQRHYSDEVGSVYIVSWQI